MGYTAKQLVAIAEAEIGYHEKAGNSNLDSKTANSGKGNYTSIQETCTKRGTTTATKTATTGAISLWTGAFSNFAEARTKLNILSAKQANTAQAAASR